MSAPRLRFWEAMDRNGPMASPYLGPCWMWTAMLDPKGYGRLYAPGPTGRRGRRVKAYKHAYELMVGPVPEGLQLDHLCRNRACVNPAHLEPVTASENARRGQTGWNRRGITHCKRGHPFDDENTYVNNGKRFCRTCLRMHDRRKAEARRAARLAQDSRAARPRITLAGLRSTIERQKSYNGVPTRTFRDQALAVSVHTPTS